jgi:phosphoribosyl 1,2-cyclic phosphate phosphodiesterase
VRLHFLGTGTSFGVPVVGCGCSTCTSEDPRDRRTRHGAVLQHEGGTMLVDTPPELRLQLVAAGIARVDAVWFTHDHADHTHGIDDLRVFSVRLRQHVQAYADSVTAASLRRKFRYIFDDSYQPPEGTSKPEIRLHEFAPGQPVEVAGRALVPLPVPHGDTTAFGFRCGELGYITDAKLLSEPVHAALAGVRVLVLNALWFGNPHPTHLNVEEAVETARRVGAEQTYLTHLTHRVRHAQLAARLPPGVHPAYDGLVIDI